MKKITRKTALKRIEAIMNTYHGRQDCFICITPVAMLNKRHKDAFFGCFQYVMKC